jgi:photosystem II stability/assembly factor-like uncharacterized protein
MTKLYFAVEEALVVLSVAGSRCRAALRLDGRRPQCVTVDPLRPQLAYCGTYGDGVWCSDDSGKTWRPTGEGVTHSKVLSVAVSRLQCVGGRGVVYAGTEPSALFRSEDGGETWCECRGLNDLPSAGHWSFPPRPTTHHVRWITQDPHQEGRLYVAIEAGALIRSPDGGTSWQDRTPDGPRDTHQLATHLSSPGRLYSAAGDGYFESRDGGDTWQRLEDGLRRKYVWSVAVDQGDADNVIVSSAASPRHSHGDPGESFLYRRTSGSTWHEIRDGLPDPSGRRTAVLAAHPSEPRTFYAAWERDVFRSTDGGENWTRLETPELENRRIVELCAMVAAEDDELSDGPHTS